MSTFVRTTEPDNHRSARRRRRLLIALVASIATVTGPLVVASGPAEAGPIDVGWSASGPGNLTLHSGGADAAAAFSYDLPSAGFTPRSWDFTAIAANAATPGNPIKVPWTWQGLHAWFGVTAQLQPIVNGVPVTTPETQISPPPDSQPYLINAGPQNCCTTPSNGFVFGNVATFENLQVGDRYGFRLIGRNGDSNNFLRGTFTLSTRPYLAGTFDPTDNRQWTGASVLSTAGLQGQLAAPGEARWYKFPVVPGQTASVDLSQLSEDYDLALYGDIGKAFQDLFEGDLTALAAASASNQPGAGTQAPVIPDDVKKIATSADTVPSATFAPRVYAPRVYAPRVYAPRVYAPRVYAPRVYAPRVYAPNSYAPDLASDPKFRDAFSAAQDQTLLVASVKGGTSAEKVTAATNNTTGNFYVRVQGHDDKVFDVGNSYQLGLTLSGIQACLGEEGAGLLSYGTLPTTGPTVPGKETVILTDTDELNLFDDPDPEVVDDDYDLYMKSLRTLAADTEGVVVDLHESLRVTKLQEQADTFARCPYATNLVADAIKDVVDTYRSQGNTLKYVVLAGGDEVIPFFRYPDTSGLGPESQFELDMLANTPAGASLDNNQVLGQDAYGARTELTIGGVSVPVPDLAVGRLVKTPDEIEATVAHFHQLKVESNGTLPVSAGGVGRSLVTGYDFLADAANRVNAEFVTALPGGEHDTLIETAGTPHEDSWDAAALRHELFANHHDLVYLAGHFSATDTLAANFDQDDTFAASDLAKPENAGLLTDTLVLSAGCHSGYNIVDLEAGDVPTAEDWSQQLARQQALLIGGTGYQYGDSDFLEYSERLYHAISKRLREGPTDGDAGPVAIGEALALAKQDYLATLSTLQGIDQKAVLQATLYGLPMTGFDAPGRQPIGGEAPSVQPTAVTTGPGSRLGLFAGNLGVNEPNDGDDEFYVDTPLDVLNDPPGTRHSKYSEAAEDADVPDGLLTWREGLDGVTVEPGMPALPKQVVNVTANGLVLRGVGFRAGYYRDTGNLVPLTGAPAIEGATANTTFDSPTFFPEKLATANYFGALGASGRTSLILSPTQYRNDPGIDTGANPEQLVTNTERAYSKLGFRLFYSGDEAQTFGGAAGNTPALASAPTITDAQGTLGTGRKVTFSVRASGDPSAGVQEVWVTWTGGPDGTGAGRWRSLNLTQDALDSTLWTGTLDLNEFPAVDRDKMRFLVQAANGVGAVGLDTADGDGYPVGVASNVDASEVHLTAVAPDPANGSPLGVSAKVTGPGNVPIAGRTVTFSVIQGGQRLFGYGTVTNSQGVAVLAPPTGTTLPVGAFTVVAEIFDAQGNLADSDTIDIDRAHLSLSEVDRTPTAPFGVVATVADHDNTGLAGRTVRWTVSRYGEALYDSQDTVTAGTAGTALAPAPADGRVPSGPLTLQAQLLGLNGQPIDTKTFDVVLNGLVITPTPAFLETKPNNAFPPLSIRVTDARGDVKGAPVEMTLPALVTGQPGATSSGFAGSPPKVTLTTNTSGNATVPTMTARPTVGSFLLTMTSSGSVGASVPMAVQYGIGKFVSPVVGAAGTTTTGATGTTPVKVSVLGTNGQPLSDQEAANLLSTGRVQIRYQRIAGPTPPALPSSWTAVSTSLISYVAAKDFFQADLKASTVGWTKGNTYRVEFRVLASGTAATPNAQSDFDLGSAFFNITVTK